MLSVEQVHALEERVEKAVSYIGSLRTENAELRKELERTAAELGAAKARNAELEAAALAFRNDQARIETGIVHALEKLDMFEDLVMQTKPQGGAADSDAQTVNAAEAAAESREAPAAPSKPAPEPPASPDPAPEKQAAEAAPENAASAGPLPAKSGAQPAAGEPKTPPAGADDGSEGELDIF